MNFDARDRARVTRWSDVAFWLHLLAAPMIVHPVFALAGLLHGSPAPGAAVAVIARLCRADARRAGDRPARAARLGARLCHLRDPGAGRRPAGRSTLSLALTALVIGGFLVLLSAAWRPIRARVVALLPPTLTARLPVAAD